MSEQNNFQLRKATRSDIKNIYELSNEDNVRENSTNSEPIVWENHVKWFQDRLDDEDSMFLIAEDESNQFLGQIRYQFKKMQAIVSISVAPDFRGLDLAAPIISQSAKYLFENNEKIEFILAYIKEINIPSIKAFEQAGYNYFQQELINDEIFLVYRFLRN